MHDFTETQMEELETAYVITDLELVELEDLRTDASMDHSVTELSWLPFLHYL